MKQNWTLNNDQYPKHANIGSKTFILLWWQHECKNYQQRYYKKKKHAAFKPKYFLGCLCSRMFNEYRKGRVEDQEGTSRPFLNKKSSLEQTFTVAQQTTDLQVLLGLLYALTFAVPNIYLKPMKMYQTWTVCMIFADYALSKDH